jgi:hypothetical protein
VYAKVSAHEGRTHTNPTSSPGVDLELRRMGRKVIEIVPKAVWRLRDYGSMAAQHISNVVIVAAGAGRKPGRLCGQLRAATRTDSSLALTPN